MNQYEAMFLFDPTYGASFDACESEVKRLMERAGAELLFCRKWEERRLAHRIKGRKRGVYALVYFKAPPDKITPLERDAQISENILRLLVLRADYVTPELMELAIRHQEAGAAGEGGPPRDRAPSPSSGEKEDELGVDKPEAAAGTGAASEVAPEAATAVAEPETAAPVTEGSADDAPEKAREETD